MRAARLALDGRAAARKNALVLLGTRPYEELKFSPLWRGAADIPRRELLILWGTRNGETARIERSWLSNGVIVLPGTVTKNKRDHAIPVLPMAQQVLDSLPYSGRYFFPGRKAGTHLNDGSGRFKYALDEASGVTDWDHRGCGAPSARPSLS